MLLNHSGTIEDCLDLSRQLRQTRWTDGTMSGPTMRGLSNLRTRTSRDTGAGEMYRLRVDALRSEFQERTAHLFSKRCSGQKTRLANGASRLRSLFSQECRCSAWNQRELFQGISEEG